LRLFGRRWPNDGHGLGRIVGDLSTFAGLVSFGATIMREVATGLTPHDEGRSFMFTIAQQRAIIDSLRQQMNE
jgi:hypothetical protein